MVPPAGPSASSHMAVLHSSIGLASPKLLPGGNSKPVLGPGPPRRQPSGRRDAAGGEESGGWGRLKSVGGGQSQGTPGWVRSRDCPHLAHPGPSLALTPLPSPSPPQSICGDCIQGKTAHEVALLESGEKGDQGIPGVPGLDSCARVGGWGGERGGGPGARQAPRLNPSALTGPPAVVHSASWSGSAREPRRPG